MPNRWAALGLATVVAGSLVIGIPSVGGTGPARAVAAGLSDASSASDPVSAAQIARAFGHAVTVDSATTETEQLAAEPDGTSRLTQSSEPVRVYQQGAWRSIDLGLDATGDGMLVPLAAPLPVQFSAGGSAPLARVRAATGQWLTESWQAGALPTPVVNGDSATYPDVLPGVDLAVTATVTGMSEVLVVKSAAAAANPALADVRFGVDDGSLTTTVEAGGAAVARAPDGSQQLISPAATWWDSTSSGASPAGPGGLGVPRPVASTVTDSSITVDAASAALADGVTYPVYVDPPWTGTNVGWTFADSAYPSVAYWKDAGASDSLQHVGYVDAANADDGKNHTTRAFWQMDTSMLNGKYIKTASFATTNLYSFSCTKTNVELWTTTGISSATTWNSQPAKSTRVDIVSAAFGYSTACQATSYDVAFDATSAIQRAADASYDNISLGLYASSETDHNGWKKFAAGAQLQVTYESYPTVPAGRAVAPCFAQCGVPAITASIVPTVQALATIVEPSPPHIRYGYQVCPSHAAQPTGCQPLFYDEQAVAVMSTRQIPQALATSGDDEYRVQACRADDPTICGGWTDWYWFSVDHTAPQPPVVSSTDFDVTGATRKGNEWQPGWITFSPNAVDSDIYAYAYSTAQGAPALPSSTCPAVVNGVHIVCAAASRVQVIPNGLATTEYVYAYDKAGNVSGTPGSPNATINVFGPSASAPSHAWLDTNTAAAANATTVADYQYASPQLPLSITGATWSTSTGLNKHDTALSFSGSNAYAATDPAAGSPLTVDASHSFTVAAWVRPNGTGAGYNSSNHTILAQDSYHSSFYLQESASQNWRLCLPPSLTGSLMLNCVTSSTTADTSGNIWTLLVGTWNASTQQLGLHISHYNSSGFNVSSGDEDYTANNSAVGAGSTAPLLVGRARSNGNPTEWWVGEIADPLVYNTVLDTDQIIALDKSLPTLTGPTQ